MANHSQVRPVFEPKTATPPNFTLWDELEYKEALVNSSYNGQWAAPPGLYWICGNLAHPELPKDWYGSCTLGTIKPSFFLLPLSQRQNLMLPVYGHPVARKRRDDLEIGGKQVWKNEEWPAQRIVSYFSPASWAQDGSWGYRTPVYMNNRIIRLQAVLELITNETAKALTILAKQQTRFRNGIFQNRLALDFVLADRGGLCSHLNISDCCLEIDDQSQVIQDIADRMKALAHVPVQTWKGFNLGEMLSGWFPSFPGLKALIGTVGILVLGCIFLPCIIPLVARSIRSSVSAFAERKVAAQVLAM